MRITIVLTYREYQPEPVPAWLVHNSAWKSDPSVRISKADLKAQFDKALDSCTALLQEEDTLIITLETKDKRE